MFLQRRRFRMVVVLWHIVLLGSMKAFRREVAAVETCTIDKTYFSLICRDIATKQHFPESVPFNTRSVTLIGKDFLDNSFPDDLFLHPSWMNISELTITGFERVEFIQKPFLVGLHGLKYLSISLCIRIHHIHPDVFGSTPNLEALHLDESYSLTYAATENAIRGKVSRLHFLSLKGLQRYNSSSVLGKEFDSALAGKNLTYLDISSSNVVEMDYTVLVNAFSNLRFLNLSYTEIAITENSTIDIQRVTPHLEVFDVSGCPHFMGASNEMSWFFQYSNYLCSVFHQVIYYFSRNMLHPYQGDNVLLDLSACNTTKVSAWDLSNSAVRILNMTMNGTFVIHSMRKVDLSKNGLEFLSASFLGVFPSLIILNLADNHLHKMNLTDLRNLFHRNKYLKILSLRSNQLEFIPFDLFSPIEDLRVLDVGDNMLTTFYFDLSGNLDIKLLDLTFNHLEYVYPNAFNILIEIFHLQMKGNESSEDLYSENLLIQSFEESNISNRYRYRYSLDSNLGIIIPTIPFHLTIKIYGNPLWHRCEWYYYLDWTVPNDITIIGENNRINCREETELAMDVSGSLLIIVITLACCTCTCTCTCCICVCCRRNTKKHMKRLSNYFQTHNRKYKYVIFVPYCSLDSDIVEGDMLPVVINYFKENLAIQDNIVCTGKDNFIPGLRIINEIHRCLDESLVVVPVITRSFLQSRWSLEELVAASEKGKRTLILLEEQTDVSDATETVKNLVARYTRATWSRKEGRFVIRPTWNVICQSLMKQAGTTLLKETKQEADGTRIHLPTIEETVL